MRATLLALTLSPLGGEIYTEDGLPVHFEVIRTGVNNKDQGFLRGFEGTWDQNGAICFDHLRPISSLRQWELWADTHVPPCSDVDLSQHSVLVKTNLPGLPNPDLFPLAEYPPPPPWYLP
jgi:hypothetical protein